jgi:hypothetical protein
VSESIKDIRTWLREGTCLDVRMELLGHIYDGTPLDAKDVRDIVTEVALANIVYLVKNSTTLLPYLMRADPYMPNDCMECLPRVIEEVPLVSPLNMIPDAHRRIAAAVYFTALHVYSKNVVLFSHVPDGKLPDWSKRFEGTIMEGMEDQ